MGGVDSWEGEPQSSVNQVEFEWSESGVLVMVPVLEPGPDPEPGDDKGCVIDRQDSDGAGEGESPSYVNQLG